MHAVCIRKPLRLHTLTLMRPVIFIAFFVPVSSGWQATNTSMSFQSASSALYNQKRQRASYFGSLLPPPVAHIVSVSQPVPHFSISKPHSNCCLQLNMPNSQLSLRIDLGTVLSQCFPLPHLHLILPLLHLPSFLNLSPFPACLPVAPSPPHVVSRKASRRAYNFSEEVLSVDCLSRLRAALLAPGFTESRLCSAPGLCRS